MYLMRDEKDEKVMGGRHWEGGHSSDEYGHAS